MRVLVIGGTGLISTGVVKHLLARGAEVTVFNRGQHASRLPENVQTLHGDRNNFEAFERLFQGEPYEVVIDMICFNPDQAASDVRAFGGRCEHFIFCSTVCIYGVNMPPGVFIDETYIPEPLSTYGRNKLAAEQVFLRADESGHMSVTIIRPSHTYGAGDPLIDNLEYHATAWDRVERGLPVLCAGDGLGLWVATHRDDCGKLFAYASLNPKTYGQAYNATRDDHVTWREYHRQAADALGKGAQLLFMPARWIVAHDPARFVLLAEITAFHGAYSSAKAKRDVPEFRCEIDLAHGAAETLSDLKRRNAWRKTDGDTLYQAMIDKALAAGVEPIDA